MKRCCSHLFLAALIGLAVSTPAYSQAPLSFALRLPRNVSPETVRVRYQVLGQGGYSSFVRTRAGVFDYNILPLPVADGGFSDPSQLKLLIYAPGFRIVTAEFSREQLSIAQIYTAGFQKLPTTRLEGRLVDTSGEPRGGEKLYLSYRLSEGQRFFNIMDGALDVLPIAAFETDGKGEFSVEIPSLIEDPFYRKDGELQVSNEPGAIMTFGGNLTPSRLRIADAGKRVVITEGQPAVLTGKISPSYFAAKKVDAKLLPPPSYIDRLNVYIIATDTRSATGHSDLLKGDGSFELKLPAGTYELSLGMFSGDAPAVPVDVVTLREREKFFLELR